MFTNGLEERGLLFEKEVEIFGPRRWIQLETKGFDLHLWRLRRSDVLLKPTLLPIAEHP